ncbi:MAG: hypothetical protein MI974_30900 [Chitinophagales bacterium]|nr:hypothetical protein [Chitinophagales bacterium]
MKSLLKIALLTLLVSCTKDKHYELPIFEAGPQTYGWSTALKNNVGFESSGTALWHSDKPNEYFGVLLDTYTSEGFWRERISLNEIKYEIGEYQVKGGYSDIYDGFVGSSYGTLSDDGDVVEDRYLLKASEENILKVETIDTINNLIQGTFHLAFEIDRERGKTNPANPDVVVFSEGKFEVSFKE